MADNCSVIPQHDYQLLFFSETNNRSRFKFKSRLSENYRGFTVINDLTVETLLNNPEGTTNSWARVNV